MQILTTNHPLTISPQGFEGTYEDIRELVIRITLAFTLAAVLVVVVAPVFGYKVDLLVSQISSLAAASDTAEAAAAEDAGYGATAGGYAGYAASGYAAAARRLMGGSWTSVLHRWPRPLALTWPIVEDNKFVKSMARSDGGGTRRTAAASTLCKWKEEHWLILLRTQTWKQNKELNLKHKHDTVTHTHTHTHTHTNSK